MAVKLIGTWTSPFVMRARIALNLKGVEYEFLEETYASKSELLLKSNPVYKKVPVLLHDDKPICESLVIVEYIDATWGSEAPIVSKDPYAHALARFWGHFIDDKWYPALHNMLMAKTEEEKAACPGQLQEAAQFLEGAFEKCSGGKAFFGGDSIGYLDIALGCYVNWTKAIQMIANVIILCEEKTPLLLEWAKRFRQVDAVKGVLPEPEKLVDYWKASQQARN